MCIFVLLQAICHIAREGENTKGWGWAWILEKCLADTCPGTQLCAQFPGCSSPGHLQAERDLELDFGPPYLGSSDPLCV